MAGEKVILSYEDYLIRQSDINLLKTSAWLNDTLIGFYFQYLEAIAKTGSADKPDVAKVAKFIGPEVAQTLKLIPKNEVPSVLGDLLADLETARYIFMPVNDSLDPNVHSGGTHWSLLIYSRVDNAFIHFDSACGNHNESDALILCKQLSYVVSGKVSTDQAIPFQNHPNCVKQINSYDCGVHVICNAKVISEYVTGNPDVSLKGLGCPSASPKDAKVMRKSLLELIDNLASSGAK